MRSMLLTAAIKTLFIGVFAPASPVPAAIPVSVNPLSTASVSAAGIPSASSPGTPFVPQNVSYGDEADPVLLAQVRKVEKIKRIVTAPNKDITVNLEVIAPVADYWEILLRQYTRENTDGLVQFDYGALNNTPASMAMLGAYIDKLAAEKPSKMQRNEALVYWANLYNALTVQVVAQNYPVSSIRKIKTGFRAGPWKRKLVTVEGQELSLDDVEHGIMRPTFKTPLVHYMVNCASIGCPNLKTTPWHSTNLAAELEQAARDYINSPHGVAIDKDRLQASSIYKWFKEDFGGNDAGVLSHIRKYANEELLAALKGRTKINKYAYDWDINAPK